MALEEIISHIREKAAEEIESIESQSREEAERLEERWKARLEDERQKLTRQIDREAEARLSQARFRIKEAAKAACLEVKQEGIDRAFSQALDRLAKLPDGEYADILKPLLESVKDEEGLILASDQRLDELKGSAQSVGCRAAVEADAGLAPGGFLFRSEKTDRDCRFATVMGRVREDSLTAVSRILFKGWGHGC